ncbi:MAG: squalene/phytoene synthase family protein, partial [Alphaproteobacteria bacterium]
MTAEDQKTAARARRENFPVASRLIPAALRPHVLAFYAFARAADDIADAPGGDAKTRLRALTALDAILAGQNSVADDAPPAARAAAEALRDRLAARGVAVIHARHLLQAFQQDVRKNRTDSWSALLAYCRYSAAPVGRFVLDLHGEDRNAWPAADALCAALQILNHLQDCKDD